MGDKRAVALQALDQMTGMISTVRRGEVRIERDTILELISAFRAWVESTPDPDPYVHKPFSPRSHK